MPYNRGDMTTSPGNRIHRIRTTPAIQQQAKELRQQMTPAEEKLWQRLCAHRLNSFKFRRQHPLGLFIADFYCAEYRLVVEIDGGIHTQQAEHDQARTEQFEAYGYRVIRFKNAEIEQDIEAVLVKIVEACK
jgi:very-short-patch-repair endonuclease